MCIYIIHIYIYTNEPEGRRTVRRLFIKIIISGGSAPAPRLPVGLKASEMSAFGPPQGCASSSWLVSRILNGLSRQQACPLIIPGRVTLPFERQRVSSH